RERAGVQTIHPLATTQSDKANTSFVARRQQHLAFDASTAFEVPGREGVTAGLAAFQSEHYWHYLGVRRDGKRIRLLLVKKAGNAAEQIAEAHMPLTKQMKLRISGDARDYSFFYDADGEGWKPLKERDDGTILSTEVAGGFVGAVIGPYARLEEAR